MRSGQGSVKNKCVSGLFKNLSIFLQFAGYFLYQVHPVNQHVLVQILHTLLLEELELIVISLER